VRPQNEVWWRMIPPKEALPPRLVALLGDTGYFRHVSVGRRWQTNPVHNHQIAIFAQVTGRKGWILAPKQTMNASILNRRNLSVPIRSDAFAETELCRLFRASVSPPFNLRGAAPGEVFTCVVEAGEAIVVPDGWWHGTCGLGAFNAGFSFIGSEQKMRKHLEARAERQRQRQSSLAERRRHETRGRKGTRAPPFEEAVGWRKRQLK